MAEPPVATLEIRFCNRSPVDLLDLTDSLTAFGERYRELAIARGVGEGARLYVRELRSGSIVAELQSIADQVSFIVEQRATLAAFLANLNELFQIFLTYGGPQPKPDNVTRTDAEQVQRILEPTAKDGGAQLFLTINGDHAAPQIVVTAERAGAIQSGAQRFLKSTPLPVTDGFRGELLYLSQVKADTASKTGDRGVIEAIWPKPVKLHFMSADAKEAILERPENPFRLAFIVDGKVKTVEGKPALYQIHTVHDWTELP